MDSMSCGPDLKKEEQHHEALLPHCCESQSIKHDIIVVEMVLERRLGKILIVNEVQFLILSLP